MKLRFYALHGYLGNIHHMVEIQVQIQDSSTVMLMSENDKCHIKDNHKFHSIVLYCIVLYSIIFYYICCNDI